MSKFGNKMKKRNFITTQKKGFLSDLKDAVTQIPRAMKEGPIAHAKQELSSLKKYLKKKRKKKK